MQVDDLRHKNVWLGEYRGLSFHIQNWKRKGFPDIGIEEKEHWTYYIYFAKHTVPDNVFKLITEKLKVDELASCNYYDSPVADLDWHGGITYGAVTKGKDSEIICLEAGCDYGHYHDEGRMYTVYGVLLDVLNTIDTYHGKFSSFFPIETVSVQPPSLD